MISANEWWTRAMCAGGLIEPAWREAFLAAPRELFIPEQIWCPGPGGFVAVSRAVDPDRWWSRVYTDQPVVTQVDDGQIPPDGVGRSPSSSCSMPSIVAAMLDALEVRDGQQIVEIGTGTGWNAALLAARLGDENVTTVEVDPALAAQARVALKAAGRRPTVVTGDGADGYPPGAPFDRVLSTASVRAVPHAWLAQTRPGGLVVTPWGTRYHNGTLARLHVADDHSAHGTFRGDLAFMRLRDQREPCTIDDETGPADQSTTTIDVYQVVHHFDGSFAVGLHLPDCHVLVDDDENDPYRHVVRVHHPPTGSRAVATVDADADEHPVRQHGPRRLWDEIEAAHTWWLQAGKPDHTRFGLSVTPRHQWTWLDTPNHPVP